LQQAWIDGGMPSRTRHDIGRRQVVAAHIRIWNQCGGGGIGAAGCVALRARFASRSGNLTCALQLRCSPMIFEGWVDVVFHATVLIPLGFAFLASNSRPRGLRARRESHSRSPARSILA
jgi:hypothetical protein